VHLVFCNCPPDRAADIAKTLVEEGLAACVNVIPGVVSYYRWAGSLHVDGESTLLIKVASDQVLALRDRILQIHPYTVPEVVAVPVDGERSHAGYVAWVDAARPG
jgi:periplasmic divalent cation tolerance protein